MKRLCLTLIVVLGLCPHSTSAQGCTQCRDNVEASRPQTRSAYRGAISLLAGTAVLVCSAAAVAIKKMR